MTSPPLLAETILQCSNPEQEMFRSLNVDMSDRNDEITNKLVLREYINMKLQTLGYEPIPSLESLVLTATGSAGSQNASQPNTPGPAHCFQAYSKTNVESGVTSAQHEVVTVSSIARDLLRSLRIADIALADHPSPVDMRIQEFINQNLKVFPDLSADEVATLNLPPKANCFSMDRCGISFELSTPFDSNYYKASGTEAVHLPQGLLANPESDKRTTVGTFHVAEGHLPIPQDKLAVPTRTFIHLLSHALHPPKETMELPFTGTLPVEKRCRCWCSAYLTPVVQPGVSADFPQKHMEVRFFVPGAYVSNLAFVEYIFGNAGDPSLPENDLWLKPDRNIGVTSCIIIAPHLRKLRKKDLGLPNVADATDRQKRDGMCWTSEDELYNGGKAFKICYRSKEGVSITLVADTYYGYSKKEIKTQISYAANVRGNAEEEHSGGCLAFPVMSWGRNFRADDKRIGLVSRPDDHSNPARLVRENSCLTLGLPTTCHTFDEMRKLLAPSPASLFLALTSQNSVEHDGHSRKSVPAHVKPVATYNKTRGVLIDIRYPDDIIYVPETMSIDLATRHISWVHPESGEQITETILANVDYILPNGYRVRLIRHPISHTWMIKGTSAESICNFHKPFTVSGGGKSEISKSVLDAITSGTFYVKNFDDLKTQVDEVFNYDFPKRFRDGNIKPTSRHILSEDRTLGSVIKLLTVDYDIYTDEYNEWLEKLHNEMPDVIGFIFILKALYRPSWGDYNSWKTRFRVDKMNGSTGHTIIYQDAPLAVNYLRVGSEKDEKGMWRWRNYRLRADYYPSQKIQTEDDITASTVVRNKDLYDMEMSGNSNLMGSHCGLPIPGGEGDTSEKSYKFVSNCEYRFFQRPDDCVHPGADKQCEMDLSRCKGRTFITNFQKITRSECKAMAADVMSLEKYTQPVQQLIRDFAAGAYPHEEYCVISSLPRITGTKPDGTPIRSANVRYLQDRPEWYEPYKREKYSSEISLRLARGIALEKPVLLPVSLVVPGRRLNPKDGDIRPLAVFNPMHYQELPELFMDLIPCITGKSPSTTGAGVEGALTKGPFNSILPIVDLNNCFLSLVLTGTPCFSTAAGYIGHKFKIDHDISLIIPEVLSRMSVEERTPEYLISHKFMEKIDDFEHNGKHIPASILGYRITWSFVKTFFARVFDSVHSLFTEEHLKPELQDMDAFADGVMNIHESQLRVIDNYFADGSVNEAIPPLKYLLHICKYGEYKGLNLHSPEFRKMFTRDYVLSSDWYQRRLVVKQSLDLKLLEKNIKYVFSFSKNEAIAEEASRRGLCVDRVLAESLALKSYIGSNKYLSDLVGTIGVQVWGDDE